MHLTKGFLCLFNRLEFLNLEYNTKKVILEVKVMYEAYSKELLIDRIKELEEQVEHLESAVGF